MGTGTTHRRTHWHRDLRHRYMVVPGIGGRPRPPLWQCLGGVVAIMCSVAGLAWVFAGGPSSATAAVATDH